MSCEIIQFSAAARISPKRRRSVRTADINRMSRGELEQEPERPARDEGEISTSCRNHRLRLSRRDAWWAARHETDYWRARLDWNSALGCAQSWGVADADSFPAAADENRLLLVDAWRAALVKQMLAPAPDVAAVLWKRAKLRAEDWRHTDVKPERLQRAIDADVEWLEAHPSRKSIAASRQAKKGESDHEAPAPIE